MATLICQMDAWRCRESDDGPFGADVGIVVWIEGGKIGGRTAGRVVRDEAGKPFVLEVHRDDFLLEPDLRDDLLVQVYEEVGRMPEYAEGASVEPAQFTRWLCRHWEYTRVRALALCMEAVIRANVPEHMASNETWFQ